MSVVVITKNPADGVCPQCRQVKKFLEKGSIPFEEIMFDGDNPHPRGYLTLRISLLGLM